MEWVNWVPRLLLTAIALFFAATLGLSAYWWVSLVTEPQVIRPEMGEDWSGVERAFRLLEIIYHFVLSVLGLLFFGSLAAVACSRPWRTILLLATSWAASTAFMVCALAARFDWAIIPTVASLLLGWRLCRSVDTALKGRESATSG